MIPDTPLVHVALVHFEKCPKEVNQITKDPSLGQLNLHWGRMMVLLWGTLNLPQRNWDRQK